MHKLYRYLFTFSSLKFGVLLLRAAGNHWQDGDFFIPMNLWAGNKPGIFL